jgi:hypothetical protein
MTQLPLFSKIIFVDWHGVVSQEYFLGSILKRQEHSQHHRLKRKLELAFSTNGLIESWMRGDTTSEKVVENFGLGRGKRYSASFISNRLIEDCYSMDLDSDVVDLLLHMRNFIPVVIATDNMDCFSEAVKRRRSTASDGRVFSKKSNFNRWVIGCSDIICSSDIGVLKSDDTNAFFGPTLEKYGVCFEDALLVDDRTDNCYNFEACGGTSLKWKNGVNPVEELRSRLGDWASKTGLA